MNIKRDTLNSRISLPGPVKGYGYAQAASGFDAAYFVRAPLFTNGRLYSG